MASIRGRLLLGVASIIGQLLLEGGFYQNIISLDSTSIRGRPLIEGGIY